MMRNHFIITIALIVVFVENFAWSNEAELQLVNVVFRHGSRTPELSAVYPSDIYLNKSYFPEGFGALTNKGKREAYKLGQFLRQKYDNFLGSTYIPSNVYARSTNFDRTKMSLQLLLAGLYPPHSLQRWEELLNWQPIPIIYVSENDELYVSIFKCKKFYTNYMNVQKRPEVAEKLARFENLIKNVTRFTGRNVRDFFDLYVLYGHLQSQQAMDLKLPNWTHDLFPSGELLEASLTELEILNYNDVLKKMIGGPYLRKVSESMAVVNNSSIQKTNPKVYLYSSHDISVSGIIAALNLKNIQVPNYSCAIIVELWLKDGIYYVKVLYYLGESSKVEELQIPNCSKPCPLDDFTRLTKNVIPSNEELKCN